MKSSGKTGLLMRLKDKKLWVSRMLRRVREKTQRQSLSKVLPNREAFMKNYQIWKERSYTDEAASNDGTFNNDSASIN